MGWEDSQQAPGLAPCPAPPRVFQGFWVMVIILTVEIMAATVVLAFFPVVSAARLLPLHVRNRWNQWSPTSSPPRAASPPRPRQAPTPSKIW